MRRRLLRMARKAGQSLAETGMVLIFIYLPVMCAVFDYGRVFFIQMTMQYAMREAGRFAVTGQHLTNSAGQTLSRTNSILQTAQVNSFGYPLSGYSISSQNGGSNSAGGPSDIVTISVTYDVTLVTPFARLFFANGIYHCTASTTFKNEPFPPTLTN